MDNSTNKFFSRNKNFKDIFNYAFKDNIIINENDLVTEDEKLTHITKTKSINKERDIYKILSLKEAYGASFVLLGLENQTYIDYSMVVRCLVYDALSYDEQVNELSYKKNLSKNGNDVKINTGMYLSRINKTDKLMPVITVVLYFGNVKWDGFKDLYSMFDEKSLKFKDYINNYKMLLIDLNELTEDEINDNFNNNLSHLLMMIKLSQDKNKLNNYINLNNDYFKNVDIIEAKAFMEITKTNIKIQNGKGKINMCKAIEDMREECIAIGEAKGITIGKEEDIRKMYNYGIKITEISKILELDINYINKVLKIA